jgi:hypothetical protein
MVEYLFISFSFITAADYHGFNSLFVAMGAGRLYFIPGAQNLLCLLGSPWWLNWVSLLRY